MKHGRRKQANAWDSMLAAMTVCGHHIGVNVAGGYITRNTDPRKRTLHEVLCEATVVYRRAYAETAMYRPSNISDRDSVENIINQPIAEPARAIVEMTAIAWSKLRPEGPNNALENLMPLPNNDEIVAMRITREQRESFEEAGDGPPPMGAPGNRVWYMEIEQPPKGYPRGIARWEVLDHNGQRSAVRTAAIWTEGKEASEDSPLVMSMSWGPEGERPTIGAIRMWSPERNIHETRPNTNALKAQEEFIRRHMVRVIMHRAIAAWTRRDASRPMKKAAIARKNGELIISKGPKNRKGHQSERKTIAAAIARQTVVHTECCPPGVETLTKHLPEPRTGLDALLVSAARTADANGPSLTHKTWGDTWWSRAEQGTLAWYAATALAKPEELIDGKFLHIEASVENVLGRPAPVAVRCASELVWKTLTQTARDTILTLGDKSELQGILVPKRLWKAIGEAGPHPNPINLYDETKWWYVEIEQPEPGEPTAIATWVASAANGTRARSGAAIWTNGEGASRERPVVTGWRLKADGSILSAGSGEMGPIPVAEGESTTGRDPMDPKVAQRLRTRTEIVLKEGSKILAKVQAAITEHVVRGRKTPLKLTQDNRGRKTLGKGTDEPWNARDNPWLRTPSSIFALVQAPEPMVAPAQDTTRGTGSSNTRDGKPLETRQKVGAHYKNQPYGPKSILRKTIIVEGYERGPEPREDQVTMIKLGGTRR